MQALRPEMVLSRIEHRPYPVPSGPWVLFMSWQDLLFMHWPVDVEALRSLVPPALHRHLRRQRVAERHPSA